MCCCVHPCRSRRVLCRGKQSESPCEHHTPLQQCADSLLQAAMERLREEVLQAERAVLYTLGFDLHIDLPYTVSA
jgi:hypothetical protein